MGEELKQKLLGLISEAKIQSSKKRRISNDI